MVFCPECNEEISATNEEVDSSLEVCPICGTVIYECSISTTEPVVAGLPPVNHRLIRGSIVRIPSSSLNSVFLKGLLGVFELACYFDEAVNIMDRASAKLALKRSKPLYGAVALYLARKYKKSCSLKCLSSYVPCDEGQLVMMYQKMVQDVPLPVAAFDYSVAFTSFFHQLFLEEYITGPFMNPALVFNDVQRKFQMLHSLGQLAFFHDGRNPQIVTLALTMLAMQPLLVPLTTKNIFHIASTVGLGRSTLQTRIKEFNDLLNTTLSTIGFHPRHLLGRLECFYKYFPLLNVKLCLFDGDLWIPPSKRGNIRDYELRLSHCEIIKAYLQDPSPAAKAVVEGLLGKSTVAINMFILAQLDIPCSILVELSENRLSELVETAVAHLGSIEV